MLVLTNGDRGSNDPRQDREGLASVRRAETAASAEYLGLTSHGVLDTHDGELANTSEVRAEIVRAIRRTRPGMVITCDPTAWFFDNTYYNHHDHRTAGAVTLDAVFPAAGNPHFFPEQLAEGLEPWTVPEVWLAWTLEPSHREDVSGHMEAKLAALGKHVSQVEGGMLGWFEGWLVEEAQSEGAKIGVEHAEAFRVLKLSED